MTKKFNIFLQLDRINAILHINLLENTLRRSRFTLLILYFPKIMLIDSNR